MHDFVKVFEFAASLGAFEGYVYGKRHESEFDMAALDNWSGNIATAFQYLPDSIKIVFQAQCDKTAGRAIRSIEPVLGAAHPITQRIYSVISSKGPLPESADDFNKKKWFSDES